MARELVLNMFHMNTVGHQAPGLWTHPRDRSREYKDLTHWVELARTLEAGLIDGLFIADVLGVYDVYGAGPETALRAGAQVPVNDPMLLISAMAAVTEHLGLAATCNLGYEPPYMLARRFSTLDHLTRGRVGWNIVTGYLNSAAKGLGLERQLPHDERYDQADEYMEVVYRLWEESWADDAVVLDAARRTFTDPDRVRRIRHHGRYYDVDAIHLCEPSPQRTPLLYQAGSSGRGQQFAARHAECVFVNGPSAPVVAPYVRRLRELVQGVGRRPDDVRILSMATVIVDRTDALAREKLAEYRRHVDHEGTLALMSGWTGIDFSQYDLDDEVRHIETDAMQTAVQNFTSDASGRRWTIRDIAEFGAIGGRGPKFVGSPATVADALIEWSEQTGVDGFNLAYAVMPESFTDFIEVVVPELQTRGRFKTAYRPGTLREKLFGEGSRLPARHPASQGRQPTRPAPDLQRQSSTRTVF